MWNKEERKRGWRGEDWVHRGKDRKKKKDNGERARRKMGEQRERKRDKEGLNSDRK